MWGSFLDKGKELAAQAKRAAEELDKHLNESVGVVNDASATASTTDPQSIGDTLDENDLNDAWDEDEAVVVDTQADSAVAQHAPVHESETIEEEVNMEPEQDSNVVQEEDAEPELHAPPSQEGWGGSDDVDLDTVTMDELPVEEIPEPDATSDDVQSDETELRTVDVPVEATDESVPTPSFGSLFGNIAALVQQPLASETHEESFQEDEVVETEDPIVADDLEADNIPDAPIPTVDDTSPPTADSEETEVLEEAAPNSIATMEDQVSEEALVPDQVTESTVINPPALVDLTSEQARELTAQLNELQERLKQRETQLLSKTEQLAIIEKMHETEKEELAQKVHNTKEEAKRRIQKAKERVDAVELKLKNLSVSQSSSAGDAEKQAELVSALRAEGEKLARKQADMEAAVRSAKAEARELHGKLEETESTRDKALVKIATLETDLKSTRDDLSSARHGESQAGKLDVDLRNVRDESEKRATTILTLEQEVKELKATQKELRKELAATRKGAAVETEQERKKLISEHNHLVSDLETKLRCQERDAGVREDALRTEVDELRKRWQDAVRRADSLSVDVQSSTAPLLRQLESTNKQNRARASAWAELETQLRTELEESVVQTEMLTKERGELKTKCTRLERSTKEYEAELKQIKGELHDKSERVRKLEHQLAEMETEGAKSKAEWAEVERLANEGVSRVRSEMTRTVVDAEERHRVQMESLETQLRVEREQRTQLEQQVQGLLENTGVFVPSDAGVQSLPMKEASPKRLRHSQGQAEILTGALGGIGEDDQSDVDDDENDVQASGTSSFAALEQLTSSLKATKVEVASLRTRLSESEKTREDLVQILAESRNAREKLPLFEARVQELTTENRELTQEVMGLRDDIADVRELYRGQLNALLEAQALRASNGHAPSTSTPPNEAEHPTVTDAEPAEKGEANEPVEQPTVTDVELTNKDETNELGEPMEHTMESQAGDEVESTHRDSAA